MPVAETEVFGVPDGAVMVSGSALEDPPTLGVDIGGEPDAAGGLVVFEYQMPVAQTTVVVNHNLGHDPTSIQVFDGGGICDDYSVTFTIPGAQVLLGFDVSVAALIRLS